MMTQPAHWRSYQTFCQKCLHLESPGMKIECQILYQAKKERRFKVLAKIGSDRLGTEIGKNRGDSDDEDEAQFWCHSVWGSEDLMCYGEESNEQNVNDKKRQLFLKFWVC